MKPARGFTLMEIGVVMAVMAILLAAMAVTTSRFFSNAKAERVSREIDGLLLASAMALKSNVQATPGTPDPIYTLNNFALAPLVLDNTIPRCFDLSVGGDGQCNKVVDDILHKTSFTPGTDWTSAVFPNSVGRKPAPPPLLTMFGGAPPKNSGYNPFCTSYLVCMYAHRVDVATCVPKDDYQSGGLSRMHECGMCNVAIPGSGELGKCVFGSRNANGSAATARLSYDDRVLGWNPNYLP